MKAGLLSLVCLFTMSVYGQWDGNTTPTYSELIAHYKNLDQKHNEIELYEIGKSDAGLPIYCCFINGTGDSVKTILKAKNETTLLINNGIHPGEPDGINACLLWIDRWIKLGKKTKDLPVIAIIPAYNVGGMLNRSSTSRANQNGPESYGFRGNASNLDLNRDFIKMDSENAKSLVQFFHAIEPDVFVDTHVSNGADYQYTLTLIHALEDRMAPSIRSLMQKSYFPALNHFSKKTNIPWAPYVETLKETPDSGIVAFNDLPRYAQGFGSLFHSVSITVETHMWKPFPQRVQATLAYLEFLIAWTNEHRSEIESARKAAVQSDLRMQQLPIHYNMEEKCDSLLFKGYQATYPTSDLTGLSRLFYDRSKPYTKWIPYYNHYRATDSVLIPSYYTVSNEAVKTIQLLQRNGITLRFLEKDTTVYLSTLGIQDFKSPTKPYEGHFLHTQVTSKEIKDSIVLRKGSCFVTTNQPKRRFIVNVLEPKGEDSYFVWNFYDSYVQQKEYFSDYIFEDEALKILAENPTLKQEFEAEKLKNKAFSANAWLQLYFIYSRSPYFEKGTFNRLPIGKIY